MRMSFWKSSKESEDYQVVSISLAKKLLKEKGGVAWTEHYERDGTMFEVTPIELKGNNSKFKYNKHL